jgi:putative transposase
MRVEPRTIGSIVHAVKRGTRGMPIVKDRNDRFRFAKSLFYLNDSYTDPNWTQALKSRSPYERPDHWPEREPLTRILAWTLMPNHFHILFEEIHEGGIAKLMQKLCGSMSAAFNAKYSEKGSIFQGAYKSRTVNDDLDLQYLAFYIQVKNVLELYPGRLTKALKNFDSAWNWAVQYPFSSFNSYATNTDSPIIDKIRFFELFEDFHLIKADAREMLVLHMQSHDEKYSDIALEPWE